MRCPACGESQNVAKVSTLYVAGIEATHPSRGRAAESSSLPLEARLPEWAQELSAQELGALSKRFTPPSSKKKETFRPIHPDMAVIAFSLLAPLFIYRIWTTQPEQLPLILIVLAGFYGFYLWQRRGLVERYQKLVETRKQDEIRIHKAVGSWMKLYYCSQDDVIFDPDRGDYADPERLHGYILE
jgi:hypothetical protein